MFGAEDEDGDFLSPTGGAKLASLFGFDQATSQGNESFQYTAPKQPRKSSNPVPPVQKQATPPGAPAVLSATAVQAFRYINGQYVKQGKLGAAVLGNHTTKEYKLLLYMSQQKQVTAAKIHIGFVFTVQPNNYCTFYDDQRQNWSLMFETEKASGDFCKEVCVAKVNSVPSLEAVLVQELSVGEGQAVENGDSLEVAYTGWLLQNHGLGQVFDSNQNKDKLLRLKLGAGKVIKGWEEAMVGMKKSGRRLMVIPPCLAYGSKGLANCIPADSTLVFEAELRRVKFKDNGSDRVSGGSRDSATPSPAPSPAPSVENLAPEALAQTPGPGRPGEPPLRAKSNSLSEQLANPDSTKAKLISRMAKMGQPMLPFMTGVVSQPESSDSEIEDTGASRIKERLAVPTSPVPVTTAAPLQALSYPLTTQPSALLPVAVTGVPHQAGPSSTSHAFQPYPYTQSPVATSHIQRVGQVYPAQTVPYMGSGDVTSFLMTEARQHNTEIRLSVGKVADKVDQLTSKMDDLQRQSSLSMGMSGMSMETSMIMHSIQRIIQENDCLKKELFEKSSRIEEQTRKIGELINQNQRSMEQSNMLLEQRTDCLKSSSEQNHVRLLQAEQEKHALPQDLGSGQVRLTEELAASTARVSQLQLEATSLQQRALELQSKLTSALQDSESNSTRMAAMEAQLEELRPTAEQALAQYRAEKQRRKETELRVNTVEEEVQDLKADKESLERMLADRKRKWQAERQSRDEELEEVRRSSQQEVDNLRAQLRKARTCSSGAASQQLAQLQQELEEEWRGRCEQALVSTQEQHGRERAELTEQRDALEARVAQLQDKLTSLKQSRASEEQASLQNQGQEEELRVLQDKYTALEKQAMAVKGRLEARVAELENKPSEQSSGDTAGEVKRVMNGVFHSLRGEFELNESYTGQAVLGVIVNTIKNVTLQLLSGAPAPSVEPSQRNAEEEDDDDDDEEDTVQEEEMERESVNGEKVVEHVADGGAEAAEQNGQQPEEQPVLSDPTPPCQSESAEAAVAPRDQRVAATSESSLQSVEPSRERPEAADGQATESTQQSGPGGSEGSESHRASSGAEDLLEDPLTPVADRKISGPPTLPPPPPSSLQENVGRVTSLTEGVCEENGEEPFFPSTSPTKPSLLPAEEEEEVERVEDEEEELSLKGHPPPTPLFGEEEDDEDLDWLS